MPALSRIASAVSLIGLLAVSARTQCQTNLLPGLGLAGTNGSVRETGSWDPDGTGPLPPRVVVAGNFTIAGGVPANGLAVWDDATATWSALGSGANGAIATILGMPNGDLVVGGQFSAVDGVPANGIARWNGSSWSPLGAGVLGGVYCVALLGNGDLVAAGSFPQAGGAPASNIARWNGTAWSPLGTGTDDAVWALTVMPNGDLVAGGRFLTVSGIATPGVARWTGTAWATVGPTFVAAEVRALAVLPNGDLAMGGQMSSPSGWVGVVRLSGGAWVSLATGQAECLGVLANGNLAAAGTGIFSGGWVVNEWNGTAWTPLGGACNSLVWAFTVLPNGGVIAGGDFTQASAVDALRVARWNGASWSALGSGTGTGIRTLTTAPSGAVYAIGTFSSIAGVAANGIARWNGSSWASLGSGVAVGNVRFAVELPNGHVVAGGAFFSAGGVAAQCVARWDGTSWSPMPGVAGFVTAGALLPNGDVVVAPLTQGVLRWTGSTWVPLGAGLSGTVMTLIVRANGRLLAGMGGGSPAVGFYEWDGASWSLVAPLATGLAVVELPNGELVVGGSFTALGGVPFNYVARWNGSSWLPLGGGTNGAVRALTVLPNGDVLAGGDFTTAGGVPAARLARWDGSAWTQFGGGADDSVGGLAQSGVELFASGLFARIGGQTSAGLARLTTTCPATAQALGAGCSGNVVTSTLPWTGSTWRVDGSGLPNSALVCVVNGFATTSLPLASIFATAVPGCTLHVQPDLVGTVLANAGAASVQFVLPNTPSLAGTVFHHQMVPLALDGSWTVTATNSLQLTVGSF